MKSTLLNIFIVFLKLGCTAFGGPAMIPYIRRDVVDRFGWVSEKEFDAGMGVAQIVPGATAMQVAAWAGLRSRGVFGALAAYIGFGIPAFAMMAVLSFIYFKYGNVEAVNSIFTGLKAVVTALVANATINFARLYLKKPLHWILGLATVGMLIAGSGPIAALISVCFVSVFLLRDVQAPRQEETIETTSGVGRTIAVIIAVAALTLLLYIYDSQLFTIALTMMKIDIFAFGGGYVSLPLMLHEVVENHGWMSRTVFMDGIALGQITPGPIVMTSAFVGYSLRSLAGAAVATIAVFAPSFIIVNAVAPFYDKLRSSVIMQRALHGSLISLVGLMAYLTGKFLTALAIAPLPLLILAISFIAIYKGMDILKVVLFCSLLSLIAGMI